MAKTKLTLAQKQDFNAMKTALASKLKQSLDKGAFSYEYQSDEVKDGPSGRIPMFAYSVSGSNQDDVDESILTNLKARGIWQ